MLRRHALLAALAGALLPALAAAAAPAPYLVKDINRMPVPASSSPRDVTPFGGLDLFVAQDGEDGDELWRTDGTAAGTYELVDACAGACSGNPRVVIAATARWAFFTAWNGSTFELWRTGGTVLDTVRLGQIHVYRDVSPLWVASRGLLFFVADDATSPEPRLWRSDGTAAGTHAVGEVSPTNGYFLSELAEVRGRVYFSADDGVHGPSLWRSDGTPSGTVPVWDPDPSTRLHAGPFPLRTAGKRLVFLAGDRLWGSDGTFRAPVLLPVPAGAAFQDIRTIAGKVFFATLTDHDSQLWQSDGTAAGTLALASFPPSRSLASGLASAVEAGGRVFFNADDGPHGAEPWVTDGTPAGTHLVRDLCRGACAGGGFFYYQGGSLYVSGVDRIRGRELWTTDGTAAGTRFLADLCPGACSGSPYGLRAVGGKIVVFGARGADGRAAVWRTDGTPGGTVRVADLGPGSGISAFGYPLPGAALFLALEPAHGAEIWRTDGTAAGTALIRDIDSSDLGGSNPESLMAAGGKLFFFFFADDGVHGYELWTSDGTGRGTRLLKESTPGAEPRYPPPLVRGAVESAGRLFFIGTAPYAGLWTSDGTAAGTRRLTAETVRPGGLCVVGRSVFFRATDGGHGDELWVSDGTAAGTRLVADLSPGASGSEPEWLTAFRGQLFFTAEGEGTGRELWKSDGTAAGTVMVKDLQPDPHIGSRPEKLTESGGLLYFFADPDGRGEELWRTDGTAAGTVFAADPFESYPGVEQLFMASTGPLLLVAGHQGGEEVLWAVDTAGARKAATLPGLPVPRGLTLFGGKIYFSLSRSPATDPVLWASDGTAAGTAPVRDAAGEPVTGQVQSLVALPHHLYFTLFGREEPLWQTDGTPAGTGPVAGQPGRGGPQEIAAAGSRLFFAARDRAAGQELWALGPD